MLRGRFNAPLALGCRSPWAFYASLALGCHSPWAPLKHTNLLQTILRAIPLCFNPLPDPR